jgi:hypothetical protein
VHDFERWTTDWKTFLSYFKDPEGVFGQKDSAESEKVFRDLLEKICDKFREKNDLNKSCMRSDPPQVIKIFHGPFAGILVHMCYISLRVDEYIQYTPN